jgi:hypothetical protein
VSGFNNPAGWASILQDQDAANLLEPLRGFQHPRFNFGHEAKQFVSLFALN